MAEGWLVNKENGWGYRFHRDEKSWGQHPRVFVDKGRKMLDGSPALLKTRQHLRRQEAEKLWKSLLSTGWIRSEPLWGANAEP